MRTETGATRSRSPPTSATPTTASSIVARTLEHFGRIDVLVNNDGAPPLGRARRVRRRRVGQGGRAEPDERRAPVARSRCPSMRANGFGRIVNITALSVLQPMRALRSVGRDVGRRDRLCEDAVARGRDRQDHRQHDLPGTHRHRHGSPRCSAPVDARLRSKTPNSSRAMSEEIPMQRARHARRDRRARRPSRFAVRRATSPARRFTSTAAAARACLNSIAAEDAARRPVPGTRASLDFEQLQRDYPPPPDLLPHDVPQLRATRCARCRKSAFWRR